MAVPSRSKQIEGVARFLEDPANEERTVGEVAKLIIDGIYDMWTADQTQVPFPLIVGKAFKTPMAAKVYHVAWIGERWVNHTMERAVWVVAADSEYGTLQPYDSPLWSLVLPSNAKAGAPGSSKDGWKAGDIVSHSQGSYRYEVLAVGDKCNLLRRIGRDDVQSYRREKK